jgi:GTP1/Obg family GTP-binding protein
MIKHKIRTAAVGLGVVSAAVAAAGAYWLYGAKNAAKHRKLAQSWMLKARAEVMDSVEKIKDLNKATYDAAVDKVMEKYHKLHKNSAEVRIVEKELKAAWTHIHAAVKPATKATKKVIRKISDTVL